MAETAAKLELGRVERKLSSWRERHGGRGRPIPEELWKAAAEVAAIAGVNATARALGVDRERLARRVERAESAPLASTTATGLASAGFVEVDGRSVFTGGKTVVRLAGRDGEQLEITVDGDAVDVTAVARAFWRRARCCS